MNRLTTLLVVTPALFVAAPGVALAATSTTEPPTTTTALPDPNDPLFPLTEGSQGPAVAVVQQKLGITVDCDFGGQTAQAVRTWQTERGDLEVTGQIGPKDWQLLDIPIVWGDDANDNGALAPSEVDIDCADPVFPPEPVFHEDWPTSDTGLAAQMCALGTEFSEPGAFYDPIDDTITISGAGGEDYGAAGAAVFDTLICVLGWVSPPQHVISQLSSTRALDGMQTATWEGIIGTVSALWTYHPDQGMNLTVFTVG
jgi:peptidoglycan hydrolase-like protein with peptidoglycan-binding domain